MGWGCEDEGLGKADQDLSEHGESKGRGAGSGAGISDPIAKENERG